MVLLPKMGTGAMTRGKTNNRWKPLPRQPKTPKLFFRPLGRHQTSQRLGTNSVGNLAGWKELKIYIWNAQKIVWWLPDCCSNVVNWSLSYGQNNKPVQVKTSRGHHLLPICSCLCQSLRHGKLGNKPSAERLDEMNLRCALTPGWTISWRHILVANVWNVFVDVISLMHWKGRGRNSESLNTLFCFNFPCRLSVTGWPQVSCPVTMSFWITWLWTFCWRQRIMKSSRLVLDLLQEKLWAEN